MSSLARFLLYVKAASDGRSIGDCPFCQRVMIFAKLRVPDNQVEIKTVDTYNKPEDFLALNPEGKVPVLIDRQKDNKIITDSAEINKYFDSSFPQEAGSVADPGPATEACQGLFGKVAALIRNKAPEKSEEHKQAVTEELDKINNYLCKKNSGGNYLLGTQLSEVDCMILPRLRHLQVAGKHYGNYDIPDQFAALKEYLSVANSNDIYTSTCCPEEEIIFGWGKHT
ncbi:hypothetical protein FSP39_021104 [Pinctada imbricata]|uniref:GST N-terminal domain-containing protein n=1 Tax=Pinctada imbricata TaxID=66713 RepID=A0AA89BU32_PINIB|nr:hypothetical protein FSP39_021104 [Pinctada imbricata]